MAATLAMERSKRQIKPNLTRTDFGYVERTRPINKQPKKPKLMEEDEGGGGGGDARNLTVDFSKLDMATLKRYKRHYRLKTRQNVTKTELAVAVARHFASQAVDEVRARRRLPSARPARRPPPARRARPPRARSRRSTPHLRRPTPSPSSCTRRARCTTTGETTSTGASPAVYS